MSGAADTTTNPRALWEEVMSAAKLRDVDFTTLSGEELQALYTSEDVSFDEERDLGLPGQFPFTRGVHPTMYRGRLWTMRQFAGFGSAAQTNERFKFLRALCGLRLSDSDGARLRRRALAGGGRAGRRRDLFLGGHGDAL